MNMCMNYDLSRVDYNYDQLCMEYRFSILSFEDMNKIQQYPLKKTHHLEKMHQTVS